MMLIVVVVCSLIVHAWSSDQLIKADIGQDITLSCIFDEGAQVDQLSFMHQSTGDILSLGLELFLDESQVNQHMKLIPFSPHRLDLKILSVDQNDSGLYTCMFNDETLDSFFLEIFVPPRFLSFSPLEASVTYPEGSPINLSCVADASPRVNITWIYRNRNGQFKTIQIGEEVFIPSAEWLDSGSYECVASNGYHPTISRSFYVTVQYPPRVRIDKSIDAQPSSVRFQCQVCSLPVGEVIWLKNGQDIVDEQFSRVQTSSLDAETNDCLISTLTIEGSVHNSSGRYECRGENILGHHSAHIDHQTKTIPQTKSGKEQFALLILANSTRALSNACPCSHRSDHSAFVVSTSLLLVHLVSIL